MLKRRILLVCIVGCCIAAGGAAAQANTLSLTALGAQGTINGAIFRQYDPAQITDIVPGSPFLTVQHSGVESGSNFAYSKWLNGRWGFLGKSFSESWGLKHAQPAPAVNVRVGDVPVTVIDGVSYWEFLLNVNEKARSKGKVSLDALTVYVGDAPGMAWSGSNPSLQLAYALNTAPCWKKTSNWIKLDGTLDTGGVGDMVAYIPVGAFGADPDKYLYLSSTFGMHGSADGGAETWSYGPAVQAALPEPATMALLLAGGLAFLRRRRRTR